MAAGKPSPTTARSPRAMLEILRVALRTDERPAWCRDLWTPRAVDVETAIRAYELGEVESAKDLDREGFRALVGWGLIVFERRGRRGLFVLRADVSKAYGGARHASR